MNSFKGYWSLKMLRSRKKQKLAQLRRLEKLVSKAETLPQPVVFTVSDRERRYRRVIALRERAGKTYREIGSALNVSATRAQRLYEDAINWKNRNGH